MVVKKGTLEWSMTLFVDTSKKYYVLNIITIMNKTINATYNKHANLLITNVKRKKATNTSQFTQQSDISCQLTIKELVSK